MIEEEVNRMIFNIIVLKVDYCFNHFIQHCAVWRRIHLLICIWLICEDLYNDAIPLAKNMKDTSPRLSWRELVDLSARQSQFLLGQ